MEQGRIVVVPEELRNSAAKLSQRAEELRSIAREVDSAWRGMDWEARHRVGMDSEVRQAIAACNASANDAAALSRSLTNTAERFETVDRQSMQGVTWSGYGVKLEAFQKGMSPQIVAPGTVQAGAPGDAIPGVKEPVGLVKTAVKSAPWVYLGALGVLSSAVGGGAMKAFSLGGRSGLLADAGNLLNPLVGLKGNARMYNPATRADWIRDQSSLRKLGKLAIVGAALTAVSNYAEYGDVQRAAIGTGYDLLVSATAGALIGAGLVALGVASAPAIPVALAGMALVWGFDTFIDKPFGIKKTVVTAVDRALKGVASEITQGFPATRATVDSLAKGASAAYATYQTTTAAVAKAVDAAVIAPVAHKVSEAFDAFGSFIGLRPAPAAG